MNANEVFARFRHLNEVYGLTEVTFYDYQREIKRYHEFGLTKHGVDWGFEETQALDVHDYMAYQLRKLNRHPSTVNRSRNCLSSVFKSLVVLGVISSNPVEYVKNVRVAEKERFYLEKAAALELIAAIEDPMTQLAIRFMLYTGARVSELVHLSKNDIDLEKRTVHVCGKGHTERDIPLHETELLPYITEYYNRYLVSQDPYSRFFQTEKSGRLSTSTLNKALKIASQKVGASQVVTCHVFRHSFATQYLYAGGHLHELQRLLGHKSITTTSRYLHVNYRSISVNIHRLWRENANEGIAATIKRDNG